MITLLITDNEEKIKELLGQMLKQYGNANIDILKQENIIKILKKDDLKEIVSLEDKIIELEESLYNEKKGMLYRAMLEAVEKPLIKHTLRLTEGNQLRAARILGINRNTMRSKIKKLGIDVERWRGLI